MNDSKLKTETWLVGQSTRDGAALGYRYIVDSEGETICAPSPMGEGRAQLIAAAPVLLRLLKEAIRDADNPDDWFYDAAALVRRLEGAAK